VRARASTVADRNREPYNEGMMGTTFKLVEECTGHGDLTANGDVLRVRYRIDRYQGILDASGMPVPGLHRIEGSVSLDNAPMPESLVGRDMTLRLEDGRQVGLTLEDPHGRVLAVGHGPRRGCACC
jgi:hypothetical protein